VPDLNFDCHNQDRLEVTIFNWIFEDNYKELGVDTHLKDPLLGRHNWITHELDTQRISSTKIKNPVVYTLFQGWE